MNEYRWRQTILKIDLEGNLSNFKNIISSNPTNDIHFYFYLVSNY